MPASWLPYGFEHPLLGDLLAGQHLRRWARADTGTDHPAVMGSRERLRSIARRGHT